MPKVLIADELSPAAVQVFRNRGVEVDVVPSLWMVTSADAEPVASRFASAILASSFDCAASPGSRTAPRSSLASCRASLACAPTPSDVSPAAAARCGFAAISCVSPTRYVVPSPFAAS